MNIVEQIESRPDILSLIEGRFGSDSEWWAWIVTGVTRTEYNFSVTNRFRMQEKDCTLNEFLEKLKSQLQD